MTPNNSLIPSSLHPLLRYLKNSEHLCCMTSATSFLSSPSSHMLQLRDFPGCLCWTSYSLSMFLHCAPNRAQHLEMQSHQSWSEGICHFIKLMTRTFLLWPSMRFGYSSTQAHCWLVFNLMFSRTLSSFLAKLLSKLPCWPCYMRLVQPCCRKCHFPLFNLNRFLSNHYPNL